MATLHPTTPRPARPRWLFQMSLRNDNVSPRPARPRWLSVAAELASSIGILAGIAILSYCVLALELAHAPV